MKNYFLYFFVSFFLFTCKEKVTEQKEEAKSREEVLVDSLNNVAWQTLGQNPERARGLAEIAKKKAVSYGYRKGEADALRIAGEGWRRQAQYDSALAYFQKSLTICQATGDKEGEAKLSNNIGLIFETQGNYQKSLTNLQNALAFFESQKDSSKMSIIMNNIGRIFTKQKNYTEALRWYFQVLAIANSLLEKDTTNFDYLRAKMAVASNIGMAFDETGKNDTARFYYYSYKALAEKLQDTVSLADAYNFLAYIQYEEHDYPQALALYQKSHELASRVSDQKMLALIKLNTGRVRVALNQLQTAEKDFRESLKITESIGDRKLIVENLEELARLCSREERQKEAFTLLDRAYILRDSVFNEASAQAVAQMTTIYETDKKDGQILLLNKEQALKEEQIGRQRLVIFLVAFGILAVIVFAVFLFRANRAKQKTNLKLALQNEEIEKKNVVLAEQKALIEHKSKEINDSIVYAKRIQEAILPPLPKIKQALPQSFVFYQPKAVVSGDFYWFYKKDNTVLLAAADCTGHGVPGAFMSMIGIEKLFEAVKQTTNPAEMLSYLNRAIKRALHQGGEGATRDGMDIALVKINLVSREVEYAGANRPLWIVRKDRFDLEEIKATKKAIGGFTEDDQVYDLHQTTLNQRDALYIFSDGYADQFGGPKGKKLFTSKLKELFGTIRNLPMDDQEGFLATHLKDWRHGHGMDYEQGDDVLIIGVRV
jgi:serine phosphatase RsbU (regulator of sigma subunit)